MTRNLTLQLQCPVSWSSPGPPGPPGPLGSPGWRVNCLRRTRWVWFDPHFFSAQKPLNQGETHRSIVMVHVSIG